MEIDLTELASNKDVKVNIIDDDKQKLSESLQNETYIVQQSVEFLENVEWKLDLRAQKDLRRCSDSSAILFIEDATEFVSLRSIINNIGKQLVSNQVIPGNDLLNLQDEFTSSGCDLPKRWIEIDNILVLGFSSPNVESHHHVFHRLTEPTDLGFKNLTSYVIMIVGPTHVKPSKSVQIVSRSFASAFRDARLQHDLHQCKSSIDICTAISSFLDRILSNSTPTKLPEVGQVIPDRVGFFLFGSLFHDIVKRLPLYWSDWRDGVHSWQAIKKSLATIFFLYFACLLPAIAFGAHNEHNTHGEFTVAKTILAQGAAGVVFSLLAGQPLVVLINTAPIAIYVQLTYEIATKNGFDFWGFYALIGLFNGSFLVIYAITGLSSLLKYSSRFVEETFALFITVAFIYDGGKPIVDQMRHEMYGCDIECRPVYPLMMILFAFVTLWICLKLTSFRHTVYFRPGLREFISNYALPLGVLIASGLRHAIFFPIHLPEFSGKKDNLITFPDFSSIPVWGYFVAMGLGFLLSLLFYVDQNISAALANALPHNLKKYGGYHLDLFVVGIINIVLSLLGLPWVHGGLPHSALHVRMLATIQRVFHHGQTEEKFIEVQETRVSGFFSHALLAVSVLLLPTPLRFIPLPVLYGVFWYLGVTALAGNQFWNRFVLLFTDQRLYPPSISDRQTLQRNMHIFTGIQLLCLIIFCFVSFYPNPYFTAVFPVIIVLLIPLRRYVLPRFIPKRTLATLDAY